MSRGVGGDLQPLAVPPGLEWRVEVSYPSALGDGAWSEPETWVYRSEGAENGWIVTARPEGVPESRERVEIQGGSSWNIHEVRIFRDRPDGILERVIEAGAGFPVITERSRAPFDGPVFPLDVPSRKTYRKRITLASGLEVEATVIQSVRRVTGQAVIEGMGAVAGGEEGGLIEVTLEDDKGTVLAVQYWSEGHPWPAAGMNRSMKYRRVSPGE